MDNLSLFEEPQQFDRARLHSKLSTLASQNIFIGTSSWKYEGWIGQIYSRDRYLVHGRFSEKRFQAECLNEYAETFPIVCGDFSFYQFPSETYWQRLFASAAPVLKYAFKVPEEVTVKSFPTHPRYGPRAGEKNPTFLNAELFKNAFLDLLTPYRQRVAVLILEFGAFSKQACGDVGDFLTHLDPFLASLPDTFRYAVEVRNPDFLGAQYFNCLRQHRIAHVLNGWTRMPALPVQMRLPQAFTADFSVARALLRQGRPYEQAVAMFSPYKQVQDPNPEARRALRDLIARAREHHEPSYIFVNNRLEGNAPQTIEAIVD
ncbi:MAG TPA: DUF72 domain-containing protein [Bryobacteraceae bacterium]|nr:DUF72 domain-containing protein [Bryobacteraceae bacterium]